MKRKKYIRLGLAFIIPFIFIFSRCFDNTKPRDSRGDAYAGSKSCIQCHKDVYSNYLHTAHYLTSRPATQASVHGSFNADSNTVIFNDSLKVVMEKRKNGLYQAAYTHGNLTEKEGFNFAFGSNRGETYLYWKGKEIYQLPITYYLNLHQWANSPGYSGNTVKFNRIIGKRCFECHSSYIENIPHETGYADPKEWFNKSTVMLSIDCERCHGPAANHVIFHTQNPNERQPMYITKIDTLSRAQRIDLCSQCHAGNKEVMVRSIFGFKPGDTLSKFKEASYFHVAKNLTTADVHGDQAELLAASKCFIKGKIECATCHSIHNNEVKTVATYSQRCTTCHSEANHNFCKMADQLGQPINTRCIDCHMPVRSSNAIVINGAGKPTAPAYQARMHRIAIYPEESQKIADWLKAGAKTANN